MSRWFRISFIVTVVVVFAGILLFSKTPSYAANEKYSYVDVAKLFDGYQKTKDQDAILQDLGKKKEGEREAIVQEVRKMKDEMALLADDAKAKKQEALDSKVRQLEDFDREAKRDLGTKRNEVVREIFKDIDEVVKRFGERKGYDFIFNERALLYRNPAYDSTEEILKDLNGDYGKNKKK